MNGTETILVVDDSENDLLLMKTAFRWAKLNSPLHLAHDGTEAIAYLNGDGVYADRQQYPLPVLMLLDLKMAGKDGFDVLRWVRSQPHLKRLPIIVLTASMRHEDVEMAFELGASAFLVKPPSMEDFIGMMRCLRDWLKINQFPSIRAPGKHAPEPETKTEAG